MPAVAALVLDIVTKSPSLAPCEEWFTVTKDEALVVVKTLVISAVDRCGVASKKLPSL